MKINWVSIMRQLICALCFMKIYENAPLKYLLDDAPLKHPRFPHTLLLCSVTHILTVHPQKFKFPNYDMSQLQFYDCRS